MKTIGLLGGMSWESTVEYYRIINTCVKEKLGGLHSAKCLLYSVEFAELAGHLAEGRWGEIEKILTAAALNLQGAGADFIIIATNTMHQVAGEIAAAISIPLLHIADCAAAAAERAGVKKIGLLGTRPTMEMDFYRKTLADKGFEVLTPPLEARNAMHKIIFDELCQGRLSESSRRAGLEILQGLESEGAEGVILGCTELGLLYKPQDSTLPLFDTAELHAKAAVEMALS
ncbi:aspartate/glutamate racemase family protein [Deltaproteobacteria bacterium OttesenSCG-928-K17]|nr:aspartate/glutamate racemase family protein [Deltaproteobacteria bacterium OttesenSCG-928-K17]